MGSRDEGAGRHAAVRPLELRARLLTNIPDFGQIMPHHPGRDASWVRATWLRSAALRRKGVRVRRPKPRRAPPTSRPGEAVRHRARRSLPLRRIRKLLFTGIPEEVGGLDQRQVVLYQLPRWMAEDWGGAEFAARLVVAGWRVD